MTETPPPVEHERRAGEDRRRGTDRRRGERRKGDRRQQLRRAEDVARAKRAGSIRNWRQWHRRAGVVAALLLIVVAATGLLLNHSVALGLQEIHVGGPFAALYARDPARPPRGVEIGGGWIVWIDGHLYRDGVAFQQGAEEFVGAVETADGYAVAAPDSLLLFDPKGRLIERIGSESLPALPIEAIGTDDAGRTVLKAQGRAWAPDAAMIGWEVLPATDGVAWSRPDTRLPAHDLSRALDSWGNQPVALSRILIDIHTGRILGRLGRWAGDLVALLLLLLAGSGLILWSRTRRNGGRRNRRRAGDRRRTDDRRRADDRRGAVPATAATADPAIPSPVPDQ